MTASISPASTFSWTGLGSALSCLLPQSLTSSQRSYSLAINGSLKAFFQVFLGMSVVSLLNSRRVKLLCQRSVPGRVHDTPNQQKPQTLCPKIPEHMVTDGSALLALSDRHSGKTHKFNLCLPALRGPHTSVLDAILVFNR